MVYCVCTILRIQTNLGHNQIEIQPHDDSTWKSNRHRFSTDHVLLSSMENFDFEVCPVIITSPSAIDAISEFDCGRTPWWLQKIKAARRFCKASFSSRSGGWWQMRHLISSLPSMTELLTTILQIKQVMSGKMILVGRRNFFSFYHLFVTKVHKQSMWLSYS